MGYRLRLDIRIDNSTTNKIHRFKNEEYVITSDLGTSKMYRLKIVAGILTQQEIVITNGAIVETGDPITYQKV